MNMRPSRLAPALLASVAVLGLAACGPEAEAPSPSPILSPSPEPLYSPEPLMTPSPGEMMSPSPGEMMSPSPGTNPQ